jgi:PKHD-type hydroxylase
MNLRYYYWYYKNALPGWLCDALVDNVLKTNKVKAGRVSPKEGGVKDLKIRDSNICFLNDQWLTSVFNYYMQDANQRAGWNFDIENSEDTQFTVYNKNQYYNWHVDQDVDPYQQGAYKGLTRKISLSMSLNDGTKYEAGNFKFGYNNKETVCKELRQKGTVAVFPSFINHRVEPVKKGARYSIVKWFLGKSFK